MAPEAGLHLIMVGPGRLELPTSRLSGVRSNHLSYGPSGGLAIASTAAQVQGTSPQRRRGGKRNEDGDVPHHEWCLWRARRDREISLRPILRKEVIQPQVPLRLPCYDFTPVADPTVAGCLPRIKSGG